MAEEKFRPSLSLSEVTAICESNLKEIDYATWLKFEVFKNKIEGGQLQGTMIQGTARVQRTAATHIMIPDTLPQKYHKIFIKYKTIGPDALTWEEYYNLNIYYTAIVDGGVAKEFIHSDELNALLDNIVCMQNRGEEMYSSAVVAQLERNRAVAGAQILDALALAEAEGERAEERENNSAEFTDMIDIVESRDSKLGGWNL